MQLRSICSFTRAFGLAVAIFGSAGVASAAGVMRITEWMYNGDEFIEFTNVGDDSIDLTGWSFDDDSRLPGTVSLSAFGLVDVGESVILSESDAVTFRAAWGLDGAVAVIGSNATNLGRADEINLFDASSALVDRLTYNDAILGGPRTQNLSANIALANLGLNNAGLAVASFVGDAYGSYASSAAFPGNPGQYLPIPEPGTAILMGLGLVGLAGGSHRAGARGRAKGEASR
jgi:predicted extracellular nuclease